MKSISMEEWRLREFKKTKNKLSQSENLQLQWKKEQNSEAFPQHLVVGKLLNSLAQSQVKLFWECVQCWSVFRKRQPRMFILLKDGRLGLTARQKSVFWLLLGFLLSQTLYLCHSLFYVLQSSAFTASDLWRLVLSVTPTCGFLTCTSTNWRWHF